ncbi:Uncharacterized protein BM_BM7967 [Brugia malayi]|uniref:Bm7967 n=1 Tax=Brugia malayi TaxID=6279 RepID=A0A0J9YC67_BRUMA|nr:Uncharacterized protein BM_BM7967 [Brugia malayi]CDQ06399.2 Bm7967 [Brugia malayi]VIP00092.1 Uncharacterized protein BM_BM7967 [Brugia malayi]
MKIPSLNIKCLPEPKTNDHSQEHYEIPFKFCRSEEDLSLRKSFRNGKCPSKLFRFTIFFTITCRILTCIAVILISLNFAINYVQPANQIYTVAEPTISAQILIKCLGSFTYVFCGMEIILISVQLILFLTFIKKEYAFCGVSIAVDFAFSFLFLLFYLLLVAIGLNSSEVSSTLIAGIGTLLKDDDLQKFMHTVDDIQRRMQCCGFAGNHTEWMQKKIIHYYDPIEDELKIMLDQADIWKSQNDEEKMNSASLSCCSNTKRNCSKEKMHQQGCFNKLSTNIIWLMDSIGIALVVKLMLSVLQEVIFAYVVIGITITNSAITELFSKDEHSRKKNSYQRGLLIPSKISLP